MGGNALKKYGGKKDAITQLDYSVEKYIKTIEIMYGLWAWYNELSVLSDADLWGWNDLVSIEKINKLSFPKLFKIIYEDFLGKEVV